MSANLDIVVKQLVCDVQNQLLSRTVRGSTELQNASQLVLRGNRGGRRYRVPGTMRHYTASAPGEVPAVRTGSFRGAWHPAPYSEGSTYHCMIRNDLTVSNGALLGDYLENGTPGGKMAPRPHQEKILEKALPKVTKIFEEPYF